MFPDPNDNIIQLSDRIKELSYTVGTNNMVLENAAPGFSRFGDFYQQSGLVFYAITDGAEYEVGSGHYLSSTLEPFYSSDQLRRYPFRSTNNNTKVDWAAGTKEVFVTYPAPFTVMTAYGVDDRFKQPERSGIAFWDNDGVASGTNILNYDSSGNWDKDNHRLGLHTFTPGYAIDVEGPSSYSIVKASGLRLDSSGIIFSGGYDGHGQHSTRQLDPFLMNQVDAITGSNAVIDVSGWVNESIVLKTQAAGQVFSGPLNDCIGGCDDGYPAFRVLHLSDIPDLSSLYLTGYNIHPEAMSGIPFFHKSGVLTYDPGFVWDDTLNALGINHARPTATLDIVGDARISSNLVVGNNLTVSGNLDVAGTTTYIDSTNVTIWDKQLELASMSGNATHDQLDSYIDDGGVIVRSSGDGDSDTGDKKWTWQNSSNTWRAQTSNGVPIGVTASGMVFGNGTAISGAYQGGSGISINGFNLDIGNLFSLGASPTQDIHQGDIVFVSGINGIVTSMGSIPAAATATVTITDFATLNSPDKVNLIATDGTNYDFVNGDHDSVAGTWESATSNEVTATSLMNVINTSSGPAGTRFSASVVGAVVTITQNTGGPAGNTAITLTDAGSVSMTKTDFTGGTDRTHTVYVDPTHLSGILQTQVTANATAALNRFPYASGIAHSGFFSEELHEISGVGGLMIANSGALQYQLDNLGDVGEVNQSAFSIVAISGASPSTWHSTISSDTKTDTLVIDSGHDNSISIIPDFDNDRFVISGANQFRIGADNTPSLSTNASGLIGHNDGITISGGAGINTTLTGNVLKVDYVDEVDPVVHSFTVQADSDAGIGGDEVIVPGGADKIEISGGAYITTTRTGDTIEIAWSGGDNAFNWFKGDPATTLSSINNATMVDADKMLVFDTDASVWKTTLLSELAIEMSATAGGASNIDLIQASGTLDQRISDSGVAISGQLNASGQLLTNLIDARVNASGQNLRDFVQTSGQNLRDYTNTRVNASGQNLRDFVYDELTEISGINNDYGWFPSPNTLAAIDDTDLDSSNDKILLWDNTAGSGWKSITIGELDDKIGAGADAGDPDQNIFNSVQVQTIAQMGAQHWDYSSHGLYKDNTNIDAGTTSDNLFFVGDTASGIAVNLIESGVNKYIKISSPLGGDITANSGHILGIANPDNTVASGVVWQRIHASGQNLRDFVHVSGHNLRDYTNTRVNASGQNLRDFVHVSGQNLRDYTNTRVNASGQNLRDFVHVSGHNLRDYTNTRVNASGQNLRDYTNTRVNASGQNLRDFVHVSGQNLRDYTEAVSGFCTVYNGSGVDVFSHKAGAASRTLNLHSDWYRKDKGSSYILPTYNLVTQEGLRNIILGAHAEADPKAHSNGSVVLGNYAGGGGNDSESHRNTAIGFKAGYFLGTGLSEYNVFLGSQAGEADVNYHSELQIGNICLGAQAGQGRLESSEGNIFLGRFAGNKASSSHISKGDYNITIGSFPANGSAIDAVNINTDHDYNLNIANLITADWSVGSTYSKRVKIGDISAGTVQPQGTLELKAINTSTTTFFISRASSQSSSLMKAETPGYIYNGSAARTDNTIINQNGFLTIPRFPNRAALLAVSAVDNPGMIAMYSTCSRDVWPGQSDNWHAIYDWHMVYSDGYSWNVMAYDRGELGQINPHWSC
jgi:uncharacterized protein YjbI with pentapeptide repeats